MWRILVLFDTTYSAQRLTRMCAFMTQPVSFGFSVFQWLVIVNDWVYTFERLKAPRLLIGSCLAFIINASHACKLAPVF